MTLPLANANGNYQWQTQWQTPMAKTNDKYQSVPSHYENYVTRAHDNPLVKVFNRANVRLYSYFLLLFYCCTQIRGDC